MPYKSMAQAAYFNANRSKLEKQGVAVDEWNKATDFHSMLHPEDSSPKKPTAPKLKPTRL